MQTKILFLVLFAVLACAFASGNGNGNGNGRRNNNGSGRGRSGQDYEGRELSGQGLGRNRQGYDGQNGNNRYRSNLYSDDDVYGYDATYPNGEAAYINYRSKDARSRRGPEFARTSRAYSRQGRGGEGEGRQNGFGQRNEYGGGNW